LHVLDLIHAFLVSSENGRHVEVKSTFERPEALPAESPAGIFGGAA
jgi:hypothetical protein